MNPLVREAVEVAKDIGDVVLVGAAAVMLHTREGRSSEDLDFALASELSDDILLDKGYIKLRDKRDSWQTPRHFKVDFFRKDVGLSALLLATMRHSKLITFNVFLVSTLIIIDMPSIDLIGISPTDREDLRLLAKKRFNEIDWAIIESISKSDMEFESMKRNMKFYHGT